MSGTGAAAAKVQEKQEEKDVWGALANPVRRALLDQLKDGPQTTGALAAAFPQLSRFAVMQHLTVLEAAGLLLVRRHGRHRLNHLNTAPLQEVRERWLHGFGEQTGQAALALKRHVEQDQPPQSQPQPQPLHQEQENTAVATTTVPTARARAVRIESELRINAPAERVFHALCAEQHEWYPYNYGGPRVRSIVFEPRVGGSCYEDWGDGAGHHYGIVTHYDPPTAVTIRGGLDGSTVLENSFTLTTDAAADGTPTTIVRHSMTAFGELSDDDIEGIRTHGDVSRFEGQLKAWVEQGISVRSTSG